MRTTTRHVAKGGALLAGAALLISACGGGSGGGNDAAQTITWWSPNWDTPAAEELIAQFEEENPDITVELVETTNESMANQIRTALDSGNGPDLMTELVSRIPLYISRDQLLDVSEWYGESTPVDDFNSEAIDAVSADDSIYAVPWRWDASGYLYNVDLFEEAGIDGPPTTWDELLDDAATIHESLGISAFGWPYGSDSNTQTRWLTMYYTYGGEFTPQEDGSVTIDAEASQQALEALAAGFDEGMASQSSFESDNTALQNLFINGQLAFYFDGSYAIEPIQQAGINVGTAQWPGPDGPGTVAT
uniref:ABC transporter substrate-binding protein n=1 Tax=Pseudactinotalea sp. TaxID=1926260 RepID=UPI003B3AA29F